MATVAKEAKQRRTRQAPRLALAGGVVQRLISTSGVGKAASVSTARLIERIEAGLDYSELESLRTGLGLSTEQLVPRIGMSMATLLRRKRNKTPLTPAESDRVVRLARLLGKAIDVFEDKERAREWLASSQQGLGGATPLEYADTEVGAREVEDLLGRIEHGVFS